MNNLIITKLDFIRHQKLIRDENDRFIVNITKQKRFLHLFFIFLNKINTILSPGDIPMGTRKASHPLLSKKLNFLYFALRYTIYYLTQEFLPLNTQKKENIFFVISTTVEPLRWLCYNFQTTQLISCRV